MRTRDAIGLTSATVVSEADRDAESVVDTVQEIIDDEDFDVPAICVTGEDVARVQELMGYYGNWYATILGLWAKVRIKAGSDKNRIAVRDVLEKQASACKFKYDAASRALTAYQEQNKGQHQRFA